MLEGDGWGGYGSAGEFVDAQDRPVVASQLESVEAPVVLRERAGIPRPGIERDQQLAVHRVVADHHRRAAAAAPGDVGQAPHRPLSHYRQWLNARRVINGAPPGNYGLSVGACPLPVVPVEQTPIGGHVATGAASSASARLSVAVT
jgi:hypothetical protein